MPGTKGKKLDRREFLRLSGMLGIGTAAACTVFPATGTLAFDKKLAKASVTRNQMGTVVTITALHASPGKAEDAVGAAFAEMDRVARLLDRHDASSPIGVLNAEGRLSGMPDEALEVLNQSREYHLLSGGTFDITVAPVVDLFKHYFARKGEPPPDKVLSGAVALVDGQGVTISGRAVSFARPGMSVTLDGIAKGYVIDAGARALEKAGVSHGLINAGGDIRAIGGKG
ncbi:MAG: FAD:protein FMN transferase, partial [Deltaproteobacteria bacterium]|nr:FAD:protein FMN transferase [Deltaproteobacteria bacterium]